MKLKELRAKIGKTQKEVAERLELQTQTYQNYELGRRQPDNDMLLKLADFFHVSLDELFGRENCDILNLNMLEKEEQEIIQNLKLLSRDNLLKVSAYVYARLEEQNNKNK